VIERPFGAAAATAIVFVALAVYVEQLGFYFTDVDTFSLIATSRLHSFDDFLSIFTSPMMKGQLPNALFFRPLTSLTWGVDELIWGLNPLGYHLTDLVVHVVNCLLLFRLVRRTARWQRGGEEQGDRITRGDVEAFVAGIVFAIHPIAMETVPAIARRPDLLFGLFTLLALNSALSYLQHERRGSVLAIAACCVLGLASKDSAVVVLALVGAFGFCFSESTSLPDRLKQCVRLCLVPLVAVAVYVGARALVLGGLGGYETAFGFDLESVVKTSSLVFICAMAIPGQLDSCSAQSAPPMLIFLAVLGAASVLRLRDAPTGPSARRVAFAWLGLALFFALFAATRTVALTRTIYVLVPLLSMYLAWVLVDGLAVVRDAHGRSVDGGVVTVASRVVLAVIGIALAGSMLHSAWRGQYLEEWKGMGELTREVVDSVEDVMQDVPPGSVVYTVNLPFKVSDPAPRLRDHPILTDYSLQGWVDLAHPKHKLYIVGLTRLRIALQDPADLPSQVDFDAERSRLAIAIGSDASVEAFDRKRRWGREHPLREISHSKSTEGSRLEIELLPEAFERKPVWFWVYSGDRVVLAASDGFHVSHRPGEAP